MLADLKIVFLEEKSDLIINFVCICKDLLRHSLKNYARQIRESSHLFESMAVLLIEGNKLERNVETQVNQKRNVLTNLLLKLILHEILNYIWLCFDLEIYVSYELDYIFWSIEAILNNLCYNTSQVAVKFAEKILKENDFVKSTSKKKLSLMQKMIIDEINILNGLKNASKGIAMICCYLKKTNLIKNYQNEE